MRQFHLAGLNNGFCLVYGLRPQLGNLLQPLPFFFSGERKKINLAQLIPAPISTSGNANAGIKMRVGESHAQTIASNVRKDYCLILPGRVTDSLPASIIKAKLHRITVIDNVVDGFFGDLSPTKPLFQVPSMC